MDLALLKKPCHGASVFPSAFPRLSTSPLSVYTMASRPYAYPENHPSPPYPYGHYTDVGTKSLLASSWRVMEQLPPPSLREILGAYNSRGDGDRDMLLAMLNAKSAEDQRLAALATLQRTMLEMHHTSSLSGHTSHPYPSENYHVPTPSVSIDSPHLHERRPPRMTTETSSTSRLSPSHMSLPAIRDYPPSSTERPRKRSRSSRSSQSPRRSHLESLPASSHDLPPSPYSSSHSDSAGLSPRSRGSMAIGSLLSTKTKDTAHVERHEAPSERSHPRGAFEYDNWPGQPTPATASPTVGA